MRCKIIAIVAVQLLLVGCSSAPKQAPAVDIASNFNSAFANVRTIRLRDTTDPILLASSGAKRIGEYIELGLTQRGYTVCRDCQGDVVATLTVDRYTSKQARFLITNTVIVYAECDWTLSIEDGTGRTIFQKRMMPNKNNRTVPVDELAGQQAQEVVSYIPRRR